MTDELAERGVAHGEEGRGQELALGGELVAVGLGDLLGNPVGAEQAELPGDSLFLPNSVRAVIASRLERLSDRARGLAAVAAIIGREFEFLLLARAAEVSEREAAEGLEELVRRRVLHGVGERFDFTHDRIREVLGSQLLQMRRKLLHASVGKALETLYAETLELHYAALGFHYREAESWEKAVTYLRRTGFQALTRSALPEARACFEQALGVLDALPESRFTLEQGFDIRVELRPTLTLLREVRSALTRLREAEALAEKLNDDARRGRVWAFMTNIYSLLGDLDDAVASGARALSIARGQDDLELRVLATSFQEQAHYLRGEYERVIELATHNLAVLPADWTHKYFGTVAPTAIYDRYWLVVSLAFVGRFVEAANHGIEALRLAEQGRPYAVGVACHGVGQLHLVKGDWARASVLFEQGITGLRSGSIAIMQAIPVACSAWALAQIGERSEALHRLREGEQLVESNTAVGVLAHSGWIYHALGRASLELDRLDEARRLDARALKLSSAPSGLAYALQLSGDLAAHRDGFDAERSETSYRKALALAMSQGMRPLVAHCHLGLGALYAKIGKRLEAHQELTVARNLYRAMEMTWWLGRADAAHNGTR